jgi:acyl carrier protein
VQRTIDQITDEIRGIVVRCLELDIEPSTIGSEQGLFAPAAEGGLELDSLGMLEVLFEVGGSYQLFDLAEVELDQLTTVGAIANHVQALLQRDE